MDKLKILITGANGFLGQKLIEHLVNNENIELTAISKRTNRNFIQEGYTYISCDFEDAESLKELLNKARPDRIINTAAISSVESCESDPSLCQQVNIDAVKVLAEYCLEQDKHLVHLSTDFVFDGQSGPYVETDKINPVNAYGQSKAESETILKEIGCRSAILRTILVYGVNSDVNRSNLVLWAKSQLEQKNTIKVVEDQWRMPTFVDDLAAACISASQKEATGIYHISGENMYSIIEAVHLLAEYWKLDRSLIQSISAQSIGQDLNRPRKTGFILDKAKTELQYRPTPFVVSLKKIEQQLNYYNR